MKIKNQIKWLTYMFILVIVSLQVNANDKDFLSFDEQRPKSIPDNKWNSLKSTVQEAKLLPTPDGVGGSSSEFGGSVSLVGNRAVIGAVGVQNSKGAAYVYEFDGTSWIETATLTADDGVNSDLFGISVSQFGDIIVIGATKGNGIEGNSGTAYVFELSNGSWSQTTKLMYPLGKTNDKFGSSVSIYQDRILIGSPGEEGLALDTGAAHIFEYSGGTWSYVTKLFSDEGLTGDKFGNSVSLYQDRVLIGAVEYDDRADSFLVRKGAVFVYDLNSSTGVWEQGDIIHDADQQRDKRFGVSVSLSNNRMLIGAYLDHVIAHREGSAYIFDLNISSGLWEETIKLTASDVGFRDEFGISVSLSGDRALVGAYKDDDNGGGDTNFNSGSAYLFELDSGGVWQEIDKFNSGVNGEQHDLFGSSVSLSGDRFLSGIPRDDDNGYSSGSVSVFDLDNSAWSFTENFTPTGSAGARFGVSVSIEGDRALIGANHDNEFGNSAGAAYVFEYVSDTWSFVSKFGADDATEQDGFGKAVSLDGDRALIGASGDDDDGENSGSAYVFDLIGGVWSQSAKLIAGVVDGAQYDNFGWAVSLSGDTAVIGVPSDVVGGNGSSATGSGSVYVFELISNDWQNKTKLTAELESDVTDQFGYSVDIQNDRIAIGARKEDGLVADTGAVYIYEKSGVNWPQTHKIFADDGEASDSFGYSVSQSGDRLLISALGDVVGVDTGSVYIFDLIGGVWGQTTKLTAGDATVINFGRNISLDGDDAVVGTYSDVVFYLSLVNGTWTNVRSYVATDGVLSNSFGRSASISGGRILVGADLDSTGGTSAGAAYVINLEAMFSDGFEE